MLGSILLVLNDKIIYKNNQYNILKKGVLLKIIL
jgi:hypothetical protein